MESDSATTLTMIRNPDSHAINRACADIHMREIPDGFLPTFGVGFLSHLYRHIASTDRSFLIAALRHGEVCGFVCGSYGTGSLYKSFVARNFFKVAIPVTYRLLNPGVLKKIRETLSYPVGESMNDLPASEILNFCVSSEFQGQGVGRALFKAMREEFSSVGVEDIRIVTGSNQKSAQNFYGSAGAVKVAEVQIHKNVNSMIFVYSIKKPGA